MSRSEWSHALLALLCLLVGTAVMCPLAPLVSLLALTGGLVCLGVYVLICIWPREETHSEDER